MSLVMYDCSLNLSVNDRRLLKLLHAAHDVSIDIYSDYSCMGKLETNIHAFMFYIFAAQVHH